MFDKPSTKVNKAWKEFERKFTKHVDKLDQKDLAALQELLTAKLEALEQKTGISSRSSSERDPSSATSSAVPSLMNSPTSSPSSSPQSSPRDTLADAVEQAPVSVAPPPPPPPPPLPNSLIPKAPPLPPQSSNGTGSNPSKSGMTLAEQIAARQGGLKSVENSSSTSTSPSPRGAAPDVAGAAAKLAASRKPVDIDAQLAAKKEQRSASDKPLSFAEQAAAKRAQMQKGGASFKPTSSSAQKHEEPKQVDFRALLKPSSKSHAAAARTSAQEGKGKQGRQ